MKSTEAGQKIYSKAVLKIYNFWVLFFNNRFLWKCKTSNIVTLYKSNVSKNHLDIGVGSGYLLNKVKSQLENVTLMDLNPTCLDYVEKVLRGIKVDKHKVDILEDISKEFFDKFDSISANYLIHCLPDNGNKEQVFKNIAKMLKPGGVAFGSTIINEYGPELSKKVAYKFNSKGIFDNANDTYELIESYIKNNFNDYLIKRIGSVCLYSMRDPIK